LGQVEVLHLRHRALDVSHGGHLDLRLFADEIRHDPQMRTWLPLFVGTHVTPLGIRGTTLDEALTFGEAQRIGAVSWDDFKQLLRAAVQREVRFRDLLHRRFEEDQNPDVALPVLKRLGFAGKPLDRVAYAFQILGGSDHSAVRTGDLIEALPDMAGVELGEDLKVTWGDVLTVAAAASPLLGFLDLMDRAIDLCAAASTLRPH
jgi:hypothetical protein